MGDKQKPAEKKRGKKNLTISKKAMRELNEEDLDQVAGGSVPQQSNETPAGTIIQPGSTVRTGNPDIPGRPSQ